MTMSSESVMVYSSLISLAQSIDAKDDVKEDYLLANNKKIFFQLCFIPWVVHFDESVTTPFYES